MKYQSSHDFLLRSVYIFSFLFVLYSCQFENKQNGKKTLITHPKKVGDSIIVKGEKLFLSDCGMCHGGKRKTDNYLAGVVQRLGEKYLTIYLTKQDSLINSKDKYALRIKEEYGNLENSHNFKYNYDQIYSLIEYLR